MEPYEKKFKQFLTEEVPFPTRGGEILSNIENSGKFEKWRNEDAMYDDFHYENIPLQYFMEVTRWNSDQIEQLDNPGFQDYEGFLSWNKKNQTISIGGGA